MNQLQPGIATEAKNIATGILTRLNPMPLFHNIEHTKEVVRAAEEISDYYQLHARDKFVVIVAAWFHDTGFSAGQADGHEGESIKHASRFLDQYYPNQDIVREVSSCIRATIMPQAPSSLIEKILCDADLHHIGTSDYEKWSCMLKAEMETRKNSKIVEKDWLKADIEFLTSHSFFTGYCRNNFEPVKQVLIERLNKTLVTLQPG